MRLRTGLQAVTKLRSTSLLHLTLSRQSRTKQAVNLQKGWVWDSVLSIARKNHGCYAEAVEFLHLQSNWVQGVFLVEPDTKPADVQLSLVWEKMASPFTTISGNDIDLEVWTTPRFVDLTLEEDLDFYGVEIEPGDTRVLRGVEMWFDVSFSCRYEADVTIDEFREALELKYYFMTSHHEEVSWWIVSEVDVYGATQSELDAKLSQADPKHLAARADSMVLGDESIP